MTRRAIDLEMLHVALRRLSRGNLLVIAERATELVPRAKLRALVGDFVRLDELAEPKSGAAPLLDEVRKLNPDCSFPTICIGDTIIVGFNEEKLRKALDIK